MSVSLKIFFSTLSRQTVIWRFCSTLSEKYVILKVLLYTARKVRYSEGFALHCQKSPWNWMLSSTLSEKTVILKFFFSTLSEKSLFVNCTLYSIVVDTGKPRYSSFEVVVKYVSVTSFHLLEFASWKVQHLIQIRNSAFLVLLSLSFHYNLKNISHFRICFLKSTALLQICNSAFWCYFQYLFIAI